MTLATEELPATKTKVDFSVVVKRAEFMDCLSGIAANVPGRPVKPILACVRLIAEGIALTLEGTNLETSIRHVARQVQIDAPGQACVDAKALLDWFSMSEDETLKVKVNLDSLTVKGKSAERKFFTQNPDDMPPLGRSADKELATFTVPVDGLQVAFRLLEHAVDEKEGRYALNGVFIEKSTATAIRMVATDGRRLATVGVTGEVTGKESNIIIPDGAFKLALRAMPDAEGSTVTIRVTEGAVEFDGGDIQVWTPRIQGAFPPWQDVVPKDCTGKMVVDREAFMAEVKRAGAACVEESKGIRLSMSNKGVAMLGRGPDGGESSANYVCRMEGNLIDIGVNPGFLLACLSGMAGDEVSIEWKEPNQPILVTCGAMVEVIMPVNLQ